MSAFLTSRGADFASPSANMRPSAPAAGHPESLVSAVFTPPPSVSIAAKQRQESVRALAAMVTAVRRLENLFLSDVAVSWVPSKGLELMQAHHRTGGVSMTNSINSSITSGATGRSPFGGHSGISVDGATAFPAALTSAYAALGAADAADLSEISHLFSQLRDRLYSMLAERVTVVEKRTLGTDTHRLQSAKERESSYQYGFHGGTMGGGCGVGCGIGCGGDHCHHHQPHISRDGSQRRRPAPAAPPVPTVHLVGGKPGGSADSTSAINMGLGLGGNSVSYDDQGNAIDHPQYGHHHSNSQQQQPVVVAASSDRFSVNPAFDQTRSAQSADGHASTMGRYETESPVRRAVSNEPIIRIPSQSHSAVTAPVGQANNGGGGKALSYVQYSYQQQQQQQHMSGSQAMNNSTVSGSFAAAAASPGTLHVHSRRTQSQLAASGGLDRSTSFAGSTHGAAPPSSATTGDHDNSRRTVMDSSYTAQQQQSRAGINPRGRSPPRSAIVMLKGQTRLRSGGAPETPQSSAAATQARKRLLASGGSVEPAGGARGVRTGGSANTSRSASGYQQPPDRSGSGGAYGSGGFGPVGVGTDSRGGALVSRSPPRGRTHQQQLEEGFSYRVGAANPAPRTGGGADSADAFHPGESSAGPSGNFMLTIPNEVPSLFGGAGANVPPPQFRDGPASSEDTHNYLDQQRQPQQFSESLTSPNQAGVLTGSAGNQSIYAPVAPPSSEAITASLRQAMHSVVDGTTDAPYIRSGSDGAVGGSFFPRRSPFPHASAAAVASDDVSPVGVPLVAVSAGGNQQSFSTAPPPRPLTDTPLLDAGGVGPHRSGSIGGSSSVGAGTAIDVGNSHVKLVVRPANDADDGHYHAPAAAIASTTAVAPVAHPTSEKAVASMSTTPTAPPPPSANAATARSGTTGSAARTVAPTAATAAAAGSPVVGGLPTMVRDYHPSSTDALDAMDATVRPSHVDPTMGSRKNSTSPARRPQARVVGDTSSESGTPHDGSGRRAGGGNVDGDPHSGPFDATVNAPHPAGSRSGTSNPVATANAGPAIPPIGGAKGISAAIRSGTEMGEVILLPPTRDELQWHRQALVHPLSLPSGLAVRGPSPFARAGPVLSNSTGAKTASAGDDAAGAVSVEGDNSRAARRYGSAARRGGSAAPVARLQALGAAVASRFLVVDVVGAGNLNGNGAGAASAFASAWVRHATFPRGTARLLRTATAPRVANPVWGRGNGPTRIVVNTAEALTAHQLELQKAAAAASQAGNAAAPAPQPPALSLVVSNDLYLPEELMYEGGVALNANSALSRDAICPCSGLARIPLTLRSERPVSQLRIPLELPGEKDPRQRVPTDGFVALRITQLAQAPAKILGQPMRPAPEGATGADAYVPAAWLVMNLRRVSALPAAMLARGVFSHVDIVASFRKGAQQQQPPAAEGESESAADPKAAAAAVANRGEVDDGRILARCFGVPPTLADAARLAASGGDMEHDFSVGGVAAMRWPGAQGDVDSLEIRLRVYVMPRPGSSSVADDDDSKKSKKKDGSQNDEGKDQQQQPRGPRPVCVATAVLPAASVLSQRCGTLLLYAVPEPGVVEQFEKESGINNNKGGFFSRFRSKEKAATPVAAEVDSVLVEVDLTPTVETGFGAAPTAGPSAVGANGASETGAPTPSRALIPPVTFGAATAPSLAVPLDAMSSVAVDQFFAAATAPLNPAAAGAQLAQRQRDFMKFQQKSETAHEKAVVSVIGVAAVRAALESPRRARSLSPGGGSRGGSVPRQSSTGGASDSHHNPHGASSSNVAAALPSNVATGVGATGANGRTATTFGTDSPVAVASASGRVAGATGATLNSAPGSISMTSGIRAPALPAQQAPPPQQPQQEPNSNMRTTSPSRPPAPPSPPPPSAIRPGVTDSLAEASFNANMGGRSESRDPAQARMSTTATTGDGQSSLTGSSRAMSSAASAPVVIDRPRTAAAAAAPSTSVISSSGGMPPLSTRGSVVSAPPQPQPSQSTAGPAAVAGPPAAGGASATRRQIMERFRHKGSSDSDSD